MSEIAVFHYPLAFKFPRRRGSPGTISVKFYVDVNGWPRYRMVKKDQKASRLIALLNDSFGNRRLDGDVARNRSMDLSVGERCSYNFAAESFHTKKLCSRLLSREVEFYWHKQRYRVFVPPFGGLRGNNVHGSSMARWKARGRLPIGDN